MSEDVELVLLRRDSSGNVEIVKKVPFDSTSYSFFLRYTGRKPAVIEECVETNRLEDYQNLENKCHKIKKLISDYELMSNHRDFLMVVSILEQLHPKSILEAGTGAGAWPICLYKMGIKSHFDLIDDFSYTERGFTGSKVWPENVEDLEKHLNRNGVTQFSIFNDCVQKYFTNKKFDCVRIDLTEDQAVIDRLINSLDYNGVLFIDDIDDFNRLSFVLEHDDFLPIWVGEKEAAWTRDKILHTQLVNSLDSISVEGLLNARHDHKKWSFRVTKNNSFEKIFFNY